MCTPSALPVPLTGGCPTPSVPSSLSFPLVVLSLTPCGRGPPNGHQVLSSQTAFHSSSCRFRPGTFKEIFKMSAAQQLVSTASRATPCNSIFLFLDPTSSKYWPPAHFHWHEGVRLSRSDSLPLVAPLLHDYEGLRGAWGAKYAKTFDSAPIPVPLPLTRLPGFLFQTIAPPVPADSRCSNNPLPVPPVRPWVPLRLCNPRPLRQPIDLNRPIFTTLPPLSLTRVPSDWIGPGAPSLFVHVGFFPQPTS